MCERVLEAIRNDENIDILNKCIDSICEEWIIKFTKTFTSLEQFQYQLAKYLHLNISPQMIAMLMKRNTLDAVYNLKSRLKKRLKADNPEAAEHYIREIFSKREIKNLSEFKARGGEAGEKEEDCRERHDETAHGAGGKGNQKPSMVSPMRKGINPKTVESTVSNTAVILRRNARIYSITGLTPAGRRFRIELYSLMM